MIEISKNICRTMWQVIASPLVAWSALKEANVSERDMREKYVLPLVALCVLLTFVSGIVYRGSLLVATLGALVEGVALVGSYFLVCELACSLVNRDLVREVPRREVVCLVAYGSSVFYGLELLVILFPGLVFMKVLVFYTFFVVSEGVRTILDKPESTRGNVTMLLSFLIIVVPNLLVYLLKLFLPNVAL